MVRLLNNEEMSVSNSVLEKIRIEEKRHYFKEFGGYLIVDKKGRVNDVVFDMDSQTSGDVNLGAKVILGLPLKKRNMVRGWFHKHPITGLSGTDTNTIDQLTAFWGECYTMVLQSNGKMLMVKTIYKDPELIKKENEVCEDEEEDEKEDEDKKNEPIDTKPLTLGSVIGRMLLGPSKSRKFKKNTYIQKSHCWWNSGWRNSEEVFNEEVPFGVTNFKPTFTSDIKRFKLWYPKLGGITSQYTIPQLMALQEVPFMLRNKVVVLDREKVNSLLLKNRIETLQCSGYVDMNGKVLFEGDNVKFTTSWKDGTGTLKFKEGNWELEDKTLLYQNKQELSGDIAIEFLNSKGGMNVV